MSSKTVKAECYEIVLTCDWCGAEQNEVYWEELGNGQRGQKKQFRLKMDTIKYQEEYDRNYGGLKEAEFHICSNSNCKAELHNLLRSRAGKRKG